MTADRGPAGEPTAHAQRPAAPPAHRQYNRAAIIGWATYDFANSAYTTLIVTFIYSVFFIGTVAPDEISGTRMWGDAVAFTGITVAVLSPFLGALADRSGYRRRLIVSSTVITVVVVALMYFARPGDVVLALTLFIVSDIAYELCGVFYNSYLPDVAPPERIGRISGYGWALGYLGGLLAMVIALFGFVQPEQPWFGLGRTDAQHVRATTLLVAAWFALFSLPFFLLVKDRRPASAPATRSLMRETVRQLAATFRDIRRYRQIFRLLVARLLYNDGLITIFAFGGAYAATTFGFTLTEVIYFGLALNVTAGLGAFLMGFLDDRIGGKRTILLTIVGLTVGSIAAVLVTSKAGLWAAGLFIGIFVGPNQAASRSLLGRFVPHEKETEFFGFFSLSGKAIAFLGPFLLARFTDFFETQRAGVATVVLFFVLGGILLMRVDEQEGLAIARAGAPAP